MFTVLARGTTAIGRAEDWPVQHAAGSATPAGARCARQRRAVRTAAGGGAGRTRSAPDRAPRAPVSGGMGVSAARMVRQSGPAVWRRGPACRGAW